MHWRRGGVVFVVAWLKRRWLCPDPDGPTGSWTEEDRTIAAPRLAHTDRTDRWATEQVGCLDAA